MKISVLIILLCSTFKLYGVSGKEILNNIRNNYDRLNSVSLDINYKLYKGFNDDDLREEYVSKFCRINNETYRSLAQTELINTSDLNININHETKQIIVSKPSSIGLMDVDINQTLHWCKDLVVSQDKDNIQVRLVIKNKTDIPYSSIIVNVDNKFWIKDITFFYSVQIDFSDSYFDKKMDYPKLVVTYGKLKKSWKDDENILKPEHYLCLTCDHLSGNNLYANYQIIDLRRTIP